MSSPFAPSDRSLGAADRPVERIQFKLHPKILWDIIQRQSGTLDRAVLEGVMNGIDAGASQVDITCDGARLVIVDNGSGFASRGEIERCFATFGQPQSEAERDRKTFGYYRMGRGQLMSHGRNRWSSNEFRMDVDIQAQANDDAYDTIDFGLRTAMESVPGCRIDIDLYEALLPTALAQFERDLRANVKYLPQTVTYNGTRVSLDPSKAKWDLVTDEAYVKFSDSYSLSVYNLGVFVQHIPAGRFGTGGIVVSRQQVKVNFARNDIMADCPVWRAIMKHIDKRQKKARKPVLTAADRQRVCREIGTGTFDAAGENVRGMRLLTDVHDNQWSIKQLAAWMAKYDVRALCVAPDRFDAQGDRIQQYHLAFVFAQSCLDEFGVASIEELIAALRKYESVNFLARATVKSLGEAGAMLQTSRVIVPESQWSPNVRAGMDLVASAGSGMLFALRGAGAAPRLVVGRSDHALGWTNCSDYIALNERLLRDLDSLPSFHDLGRVLLHELCHVSDGDGSEGEHTHSLAFYEGFHHRAGLVGEFVDRCVQEWPKVLERHAKVAKREFLRVQDRRAKLAAARGAFDPAIAAVAEPPLAEEPEAVPTPPVLLPVPSGAPVSTSGAATAPPPPRPRVTRARPTPPVSQNYLLF